MKKSLYLIIPALAALCLSAGAQEIEGTVSYALPRTVLEFSVEARQDVFHAGPYAKYAKKYLGVEAVEKDRTTVTITSVNVRPAVEADQTVRYNLVLGKGNLPVYLQMTSQGLVAGQDGAFTPSAGWRYPVKNEADFASKGMPANLTTESNTLYGKDMESVSQNVVVEKSSDRKAQEVAEKIFKIRENKYKILVGDTDATYSGEAMQAAVDALGRMEAECLTLFMGYTDSQTLKANFEVLPKADAKNQLYLAFRVSDEAGLVSADNASGKPCYLELKPEPISASASDAATAAAAKSSKPEQVIHYRIPAICNARLTDGFNTYLQVRVPVYQLGLDTTIPANRK